MRFSRRTSFADIAWQTQYIAAAVSVIVVAVVVAVVVAAVVVVVVSVVAASERVLKTQQIDRMWGKQ